MSPFLLTLIATLAAGPGADRSSLRWHETAQTLEPPPSADQAAAAFAFVNEADHPVTITRMHSSCGCTVATLDKTVYQPGERGEIRVTFRFDDRVGRHSKRITVETDEASPAPLGSPAPDGDLTSVVPLGAPSPPRTHLTLTVDIPELVRLTPPALQWTLPRQAASRERDGQPALSVAP